MARLCAPQAAQVIRELLRDDCYVIVVEHDLAVLDYLSDFICCLYGQPGAYGVVTMPFSVREGINIFLAGFVPTENLRFRDTEMTFKVRPRATLGPSNLFLVCTLGSPPRCPCIPPPALAVDIHLASHAVQVSDTALNEDDIKRDHMYDYPAMTKTMGNFSLSVEAGSFRCASPATIPGLPFPEPAPRLRVTPRPPDARARICLPSSHHALLVIFRASVSPPRSS